MTAKTEKMKINPVTAMMMRCMMMCMMCAGNRYCQKMRI